MPIIKRFVRYYSEYTVVVIVVVVDDVVVFLLISRYFIQHYLTL